MSVPPDQARAREAALEDLIHLRGSVDDIVRRLLAFDWDAAPDLVTLSPETVAEVLDRYLIGDVTAEEIAKWANAIEGRDDIAFLPPFESVLSELIFELANPEISRALSPDSARDWSDRLRDSCT